MKSDDATADRPVYPASRLLAYTAIGVGGGWVVLVLGGGIGEFIWESFIANDGASSTRNLFTQLLAVIVVVTIAAIPGIGFAHYGRRLARYPSFKRVRDLAGAFAIFVALSIYAGVDFLVRYFGVSNGQISPPIMFGTILLMLPLYAIVCWQILVHDDIVPRSYRIIVPRGLLLACAWMMWFSLSGAIDPLAWTTWGLSRSPWFMVGFVLPIVVVYGLYRISLRLFGHEQPGENSGERAQSVQLDRRENR